MTRLNMKVFGFSASLLMTSSYHASLAQKITLKSGSFKKWVFGSESIGGGSGLMAISKSVGDPAPALINTTMSGAGQIGGGYGIDTTLTTSAPLEGRAFTLNIVFKSGADPGPGQAVGLEVSQNGNVYGLDVGVTNTSTSWQPLTFKGTLQSANFLQISGSGPSTPNLTGGVPTQFGLGAGNQDNGTVTNYYDDFSLVIK